MKKRLFFSLDFFVRIALATILPLTAFVLPGVILDKKMDTLPVYTIIGLALAVTSTIIIIKLLAKQAVKAINQIK